MCLPVILALCLIFDLTLWYSVFGYFCLGLCLTVGFLTSCWPVDLRDCLLPLDCCRVTLLKLTLILELCCLLVGPSLLKASHSVWVCVEVCVCVRSAEHTSALHSHL